jgi:hypothetical protein
MNTPKLSKESDGSLTISINLKLSGTMLEQEEQIRDAVNQVGRSATGVALKSFDTNGEAILIDGLKHTSKEPQKKSS